ncbi:hypothetical protein PoMZ_09375 [Pyricularia oryzae]|uniref:Uncharacterized protein n=1 Tax=Pyricularia oryzae TaxID=318829 RepID=A0A4P7MZK9_PYROR|nr:hypothetical protein PoMZ_09375 [Pyricularia oryzae]
MEAPAAGASVIGVISLALQPADSAIKLDSFIDTIMRAQGGIILGLEDIDNALAACLSRLDAIGRLVDEIDVIAAESR